MNVPTNTQGFDNPTSQEERAKLLREQRTINTRSALQQVLDPSLAGRFAATAKADFTVGRDEVVNYPRIAGGPWGAGPQVPNEEPFPIDISYVEPCGTEEEISRSLSALADAVGPPPADSDAEVLSPPSAPADLASPLLGSATASSPPAIASPPASGAVTTPTSFGSSGPSPSSEDRQLAQPSALAEPSREGRTGRDELVQKAGAFSRPSFRRFG